MSASSVTIIGGGGSGDSDDFEFEYSPLPDGPNKEIGFTIDAGTYSFTPLYFPARLTITTDKELERIDAGCEGQSINIKQLKNSEISARGKMHGSDLTELNRLAERSETVDVLTPLIPGSGMECIVKKTERGEILGWDGFPQAQDWLLEYKITLVSTGADEYGNQEGSRIELDTGDIPEGL